MGIFVVLGVAALVLTIGSIGGRASETHTDSKGAVWKIWYDSLVGGKWHATDTDGAYGTKGWSVSSSDGSKEQAKLAADWYSQNHKRVK